MWRNALASVIAVAAAAATAVSPFLDWYGDHPGSDYRLVDLLTAEGVVTGGQTSLAGGVSVALFGAAGLLLAALALRSGGLMALAALASLGVTVLWLVRRYHVTDSLVIGRDGLGGGVWLALLAGLLAFVPAAALHGRGRGRHRRGARARPRDEARPGAEAFVRWDDGDRAPAGRAPGDEPGPYPNPAVPVPRAPGGALEPFVGARRTSYLDRPGSPAPARFAPGGQALTPYPHRPPPVAPSGPWGRGGEPPPGERGPAGRFAGPPPGPDREAAPAPLPRPGAPRESGPDAGSRDAAWQPPGPDRFPGADVTPAGPRSAPPGSGGPEDGGERRDEDLEWDRDRVPYWVNRGDVSRYGR